jgi:DNA polymerase III epsilon subunit-like protein
MSGWSDTDKPSAAIRRPFSTGEFGHGVSHYGSKHVIRRCFNEHMSDFINSSAGKCFKGDGTVEAGSGVRRRHLNGTWRTYHHHCVHPPRGDHPGRHNLPMIGLDTETTGRMSKRDRVLCVGIVSVANVEKKWYLKTVDKIPAEVTKLHKIDMAKLDKDGVDPVTGFTEIAQVIDKAIAERQIPDLHAAVQTA